MNRVIRVFCMLLIWQNIQAQNNIKTWEYWFDSDYESVVSEPISPAKITTIDKEIVLSGLSFGLHTLHFRIEDELNGWSPALSRFFSFYENSGIPVIKQVTQLQYWYDENFDQLNTVDISATANLNLDELIDVSALNEGLHTLNYRFKDETGGWSPALSRFFSYYTNSGIPIIKQVTQLQYWYDENFDQVNMNDISATANLNLDELIDVSALNEGLHTLNYRFKDETGGWSPALSRFFSYRPGSGFPVLQTITQVEYWFNQDYSTSIISSVPNGLTFTLDELIDITSLTNGLHIVSYRFKDSGNTWSPAYSKLFSKYDLPVVSTDNKTVAYRYWIDEDTTTITNVMLDTPLKSVVLDDLIDVYDYPSGEHFLSIQFKDKQGQWSPAVSDTVILELNPSAKLSASSTTACKNEEILFYADTVDVSDILWNFGDGNSSVEVNPVHKYDVVGTFEVSAIVSHIESNRIKKVTLVDSIKVYPVYTETIDTAVCSNELPFILGTQYIFETGTFIETFQSVSSCDSIVTLNLVVNQTYNTSEKLTICKTELPFEFGTQNLIESGDYTEVFELVTGCDSIVTLKLKVMDCSMICQTLQLNKGWNIFSVNSIPDSTDLKTIFQPLIDKGSLVKIQDELGNSLEDWGIFGGWTNNIGNVNPAEGYKIKVNFNDSIEICGIPVQYPLYINLLSGWNIMGYPQTTVFDGMNNIVKKLIDDGTLVKVQDEQGNSIEDWGIFGGWTNNIGDFIPGEGYKIKVNTSDTLWIFDSYPKSTTIHPEQVAITHFATEIEGNGVDHMNINLIGLPLNVLKDGDELAIFDGTTCVGAVTLMPHHLSSHAVSIVASATDKEGMAGFSEGNPFALKLWNSRNNQEFILEPEIVKGSSTFTKHETTVASLEKYATTSLAGIPGSNLTEIKCYPNPFSDEVTIEINLSANSEVEVEVLNQLGQRVNFLTTERMLNSGTHRLKWNGKNATNQQVSAGIYFLSVKIDGEAKIEKVVYSKID